MLSDYKSNANCLIAESRRMTYIQHICRRRRKVRRKTIGNIPKIYFQEQSSDT